MCEYKNSDNEKAMNLDDFEKQVKKELKKSENPSVKPKDVFIGFKECKKKTKK